MNSDPVRLLIVDEQGGYFHLVQEFAELCDHQYKIVCQRASSGSEALSMIESWGPSVVLLDAHLHDMSSFDVLKRCKGSRQQVIVTSDHRSDEIRESVMSKGATDYVTRSEDPDEVEMLLGRIAELSESVVELFLH